MDAGVAVYWSAEPLYCSCLAKLPLVAISASGLRGTGYRGAALLEKESAKEGVATGAEDSGVACGTAEGAADKCERGVGSFKCLVAVVGVWTS